MENLLTTDVAEIQLSNKSRVKAADRPKISGSKDAYDLLIKRWNPSKIEFTEEFKILLLNRASRLLGYMELSSGGTTATIADPKLVFAAAIKANACELYWRIIIPAELSILVKLISN